MRSTWARGAFRSMTLVAMAVIISAFLVGPLPARAAPPDSPLLSSPVEPFHALRLFDRPDTPWGAGHRGIDLEATVGQEVHSPADGVVTFAGIVVDRGVVSIRHPSGLVSSLEPVAPTVEVGAYVEAGDVVGTVTGEPASCLGICLHWGVREGGRYLNPLDVLEGFGPVRLLPLN